MIAFLKILFAVIFVYMIYTVIDTSYQSNLFTEWSYLGSIPWMTATLKDFYSNVVFIFVWIAYKENHWLKSLVWLVLLVCLGSIATAAYVLIQLFKLGPGDRLDQLFTRNVTTA